MKRFPIVLRFVIKFFAFFCLAAFFVTNSILLFCTAQGLELTRANLEPAAKVTFVNVLFMALLLAAVDMLRQEIMVDSPVRKIHAASQKVMAGDLSVRLPEFGPFVSPQINAVAENFNQMVTELSGVETLRTDFIANVSHEIKTPLSVIQNYATMLQSPVLPEEKRAEYASAISTACMRLSSLITNILKLNKLENQQIFPESCGYDLSEQLCGCLLAFEDVWELKQIELEADIQPEIHVVADAELLTLVWNNLLSNAMKFTPHGGKVTVRLAAQNGKAVVTVADTGCGISPQAGARIFDKFYQGDTSHAMQGNGLGLALVKRVVDIINGEITVQSEVGKGSVFTVTLDAVNAEGRADEAEQTNI